MSFPVKGLGKLIFLRKYLSMTAKGNIKRQKMQDL